MNKSNLEEQEFFGPVGRELREKKFNENSFFSSRGFVMKIQKGDIVKVISGKDAGKEGKVLQAFPKKVLS